jgi:ferredoxin
MITKVTIGNCLNHGCCEDLCPEVFKLPDDGSIAIVREGAEKFFVSYEAKIKEAVAACPMEAIHIEEKP